MSVSISISYKIVIWKDIHICILLGRLYSNVQSGRGINAWTMLTAYAAENVDISTEQTGISSARSSSNVIVNFKCMVCVIYMNNKNSDSISFVLIVDFDNLNNNINCQNSQCVVLVQSVKAYKDICRCIW